MSITDAERVQIPRSVEELRRWQYVFDNAVAVGYDKVFAREKAFAAMFDYREENKYNTIYGRHYLGNENKLTTRAH